jgi:hypothetical protein
LGKAALHNKQTSLWRQTRAARHIALLLAIGVLRTDLAAAAAAAVSPCQAWTSCLSTSRARGSSWALHRRILPGPDQILMEKKP